MFPLQTFTNKTPVCKYNLCKHSLDETTLDTLNYYNILFGGNFKALLYLFRLQKLSDSQFTTLKCFSHISVQGFQINSLIKYSHLFEINK